MMPEKTRPQTTVLVVEEEASIRVAIADSLRSSTFRTLEAAGGAEAVAKLSVDMSVDVVCLHMQMPVLAHADAWRSRQLHSGALGAREQT